MYEYFGKETRVLAVCETRRLIMKVITISPNTILIIRELTCCWILLPTPTAGPVLDCISN